MFKNKWQYFASQKKKVAHDVPFILFCGNMIMDMVMMMVFKKEFRMWCLHVGVSRLCFISLLFGDFPSNTDSVIFAVHLERALSQEKSTFIRWKMSAVSKLLNPNLTTETWPYSWKRFTRRKNCSLEFKNLELTFRAICIGKIVSGPHAKIVTVLLKNTFANTKLEKSFLQLEPSADIDGCESIFEITIIIATKYLTYYAGKSNRVGGIMFTHNATPPWDAQQTTIYFFL